VTRLQEAGGGLVVAFVEFDPPEEEDDPGGAEAGWIGVAFLQRIEEDD
jgi:hypothetical protein